MFLNIFPLKKPLLKVVWIEKELEPFIGVKMININCAISDCGLWVVNYANMGCFLPVKALFWGWETIKTCVFCTQNVCNVTVQNWNISRLAWPNAMKFFVGGNRHYIFDFMWFLSLVIKMVVSVKLKKKCVLEVFCEFDKNDHLLSKTILGPDCWILYQCMVEI